jgi:hypothetical protein
MSAPAALRNRSYQARHAALTAQVREATAVWTAERGYPPAIWTLVAMAREAMATSARS